MAMFETTVNHPKRIQAAFSLAPGLHTVVGPSGAGKTSLLRTIAGVDSHPSFQAQWNGLPFARLPHLRPTAFVPQRPSLIPHRTLEEQIRWVAPTDGRLWRQWIDPLDLASLLHRYPAQLSGGEQQRAALLRALASEKPLLLLDEALSQIDRPHRWAIYQHLKHQRPAHHLVLCSTHQWDEAEAFADQVLYLRQGQLLWSGPVSEAVPVDAVMAQMMGYIATVRLGAQHILVHPQALTLGSLPTEGVVIAGTGQHTPLSPTSSCYHFVTPSSPWALDWTGHFAGPATSFQAITLKNPTLVSFSLYPWSEGSP
jgi:ABC-type Fe3+/spermidine/putrescine transport system ATPase subunit